VAVRVEVRRSGSWATPTTVRTDTAGRFRASLAYGRGQLTTHTVRVSYPAANRNRREVSGSASVRRVKVLNAVVRGTTAADVAKTFRRGCPVGPSKLRTISLNYYGYDGRMHRGVVIMRSSLTQEVIRGFGKALAAGYPISSMRNPNVWGGNDPKQMAANNTSGFNCRKVVGNPYAQSPHSYGIALDVNTVQNPFRDRNGKWWPANGRRYIDRTPLRKGMLSSRSTLTRQLKRDDFFWGGRWYPGRDYQHFQHTG
ncbi:MAG: M15 family metallopeptidase, partial [Actinomycetes bacterium]